MSKRNIVLVAILIVLGLAAAWLTFGQKEKDNGRQLLVDFEEDELESITFIHGAEEWSLLNDDSGWHVNESDNSSTTAIESFIPSILKFDGKRIKTDDISEYGFDENSYRIKYKIKKGGTVFYTLGRRTPSETEFYVLDDKNVVYTVYSMVGQAIQTEKSQMLDTYVYGIEYSDIARIDVDGPTPISIIREDEGWLFESGSFKESLTEELVKRQVTRYFGGMYCLSSMEDTPENEDNCGLKNPAETVTITDIKGNIDKILIGNETEKGVYIKVNNGMIYHVISDYFKFIKTFREVVM